VEQNYWNIIKEDEYVDQLIAVDSWICKLKPALLELILKLIYYEDATMLIDYEDDR